MPRLAKADVSRQPGIRTRPSGGPGPRGLAFNGLLPLIKLLTLLWFTILVIFNYQLYLDNELVYRRYRTIASLYRYRSTKYPPIWLLQAEIAVKARPLRCAAQSFSIALGLKRLASLRRSPALAFALCVGHAPTTARAQDDEIARRALAVRCGRGRRAHSRQAQLRRPLSCVYVYRSNALAHPAVGTT